MAKLYIADGDPDSQICQLYSKKNKIQLEIVRYNPQDPHQSLVNPLRIVPFLLDGEIKAWGCNATLLYLAETYGKFDLFGDSLEERTKVNALLSWTAGTLSRSVLTSLVHPQQYDTFKLSDKAHNDLLIESGSRMTKECLDILETQYLSKKKCLCGDSESLADLYAAQVLLSLTSVSFSLSKWPKTEQWLQRMKTKIEAWSG